LDDLKASGVLRVSSRDFATSIYVNQAGELQGLEYDLIYSFASSLGLKPEITMEDNISEVLTKLRAGQVDLAAAALSQTPQRTEDFIAPRPYEQVNESVVCNSSFSLKKPSDLMLVSILVEADSSYVESLEKLKNEYKKLKWKTTEELSSEEILQLLDDKKEECSIIDSNLFKIFRRYYPSVKLQFNLKGSQNIGWLLPKSKAFLEKPINAWMDRLVVSGDLKRLIDKHYGFSDRFDPYDLEKFRERIETRLPEFKPNFEAAAKEYGFDWKLLAALSYQESHWDPSATSPTGVKGLMMLTNSTAKAMEVQDREDPKQSIFGGARYLQSRVRRIPRYIPESDRIWFALAAYNVGYGHLTDARAVAVQLKLNPNRWLDVRTALPKLSNSKYNRFGRFGYARGIEPVLYVRRIRNYYDILKREL
jgi:membrane-bound lytic murein transglycosylase F